MKAGGEDEIVEIDETVLSRRKYIQPRASGEQVVDFPPCRVRWWKMLQVPVKKRSADTLLPITQEHVLPGITIVSAFWTTYSGVIKLPEVYTHFTVNHSTHIVDPGTGTYTSNT
ncbi:hypothetical protein AB6A40_008375 [Gnathostoma spinigerum]|uniref:Transposase n=1 Tax=Gnathostoma spinigerum TaxID=75299 RepID=A0ABD6EPA8_9BILA